MALFPKSVDLDSAAIERLRKLYETATADIQRLIRATVTGELTLVAVQHTKGRVQQRLQQLQSDTSGWADQHVTASYQKGKGDAVGELHSFNHPIATAAAAAIATDAALNVTHDEAARSLALGMSTRLDQATNQMMKSASDTLMGALNTNVRNRIAQGETDQAALKKSILDDIDRLDVNALIDRGGKAWAPDVYAEMLARTSLTQARNQAMADALSSQDFDLVIVSAHGAEDACGPWEDTVLSLNGNTPDYPTVDDATGAGLFHVNCKHSIDALDPNSYPSGYWVALGLAAAAGDGTAPIDQSQQSDDTEADY